MDVIRIVGGGDQSGIDWGGLDELIGRDDLIGKEELTGLCVLAGGEAVGGWEWEGVGVGEIDRERHGANSRLSVQNSE